MVTRLRRRRGVHGLSLAASVVLGLGLFSCEKIVGIKDDPPASTGGGGGLAQGGRAAVGGASVGGRGGGPLIGGDAGGAAGGGTAGQAQGGQPETGGATSMSGGNGNAGGGKGGGPGGTGVGGAAGMGGAAGSAGGAGGAPFAPLCPRPPSWSGTAYLFTRPSGEANKGLCSYPNAELPATRSYGAVDEKLWSSANACGRCLEVSNLADPPAKVEVEIIDIIKIAPEAGDYSLSLEDDARSILNNGQAGNPKVTFKFVACSDPGSIKVSFPNAGSGAAQLLVMGHRWGLTSVEIKTGSNWIATSRPDYNLWTWSSNVASLVLGASVSLRLTDELGDVLVVDKVPFTSSWTDLHVQFPTCR